MSLPWHDFNLLTHVRKCSELEPCTLLAEGEEEDTYNTNILHEFKHVKSTRIIVLFHFVQEGQLALLTTCLLNPYTTRRQLTELTSRIEYMSKLMKSAILVDQSFLYSSEGKIFAQTFVKGFIGGLEGGWRRLRPPPPGRRNYPKRSFCAILFMVAPSPAFMTKIMMVDKLVKRGCNTPPPLRVKHL